MSKEEQTSQQSESLFDTNFTSDHSVTTNDASILPSNDVQTTAIIGFRILVSIKEAGIIIGKNGSVIANIRDLTGVKAGVSPVIQGCIDRILTVTGPIDSVSKALNLITQALISSGPLDEFQYFPLKNLLPKSLNPNIISLRLLIPNNQMGSIIGKQGVRIKALQTNYNVKIVASKDFLQNSNERLVELQGDADSIEASVKILSRCLIEDWHSIATGIKYYTPSRYSSRKSSAHPSSNSNGNGNSYGSDEKDIERKVKFPSDMVGCLIGKNGSRIQEIRKFTKAQIIIASQDEDNEREFQLIGLKKNVEKALSFLNQNLERERERRERINSNQSPDDEE
ncbi:hypothetical protein WICMUC_003814 [Wickerhamomyces mucosus]|uniref:K Homology domain-containing protein n=1 Tax=Wickerhamomyces mucosus TaxID=1378264 RepID=A0A9P8PJI7_9ASCO|nr:hypothetical protein WICMUC_003814 [Wickerhamomyces mucosus]